MQHRLFPPMSGMDSDKILLQWKEETTNTKQFYEHVSRFYGLLQNKGIAGEGKRIAIYGENHPVWIYALYAGWVNGNAVVTIDAMSSASEVAYILKDCTPSAIFYSAACAERLQEAVQVAGLTDQATTALVAFESYKDLPLVSDMKIPEFAPEQTAVIIYTSGTTGGPKGVMLSFDNLAFNVEAITTDSPIYSAQEVAMALLPFHHIFPLVGNIITPLCVGGKLVFSPSTSSDDIIATLQRHKVSIFIGVPRLYNLMAKAIRKKIESSAVARTLFSLARKINSPAFSRKVFNSVHQRFGGHIRYMVTGGAAIDPEVASLFRTLGFDFLEGYGMTETAPMITFTRPGTMRLGSAGQLVKGAECRLVDGEITVRGRNVMQGYFARPRETAEALRDGWLYTGDVGHFDQDGFLFVTGRKKDIIVLSNGKNITPDEAEMKVMSMTPLILEIGVCASKDGDRLEAIIYPDFQQIKERGILNIEATLQDVVDKYNAQVAPYKKIFKFYLTTEELPKTRLSKLRRFQLPKMIEQLQKQKEKSNSLDKDKVQNESDYFESAELDILVNYLKEESSASTIRASDHIEIDLGLDSLAKVNLMAFLNSSFGLELKAEDLIEHAKVGDLARLITEKKQKTDVQKVNWSEILRENHDQKREELPRSTLIHLLLVALFKLFSRNFFKIKVKGKDNIPRDGRPFILVPNHQSYLDGALVMSILDRKILQKTYFYAKERHVKHPILRFFAHRSNVVTIDFNRDLKESLVKLSSLIRAGKNVVIFPEGTRSKDGSIGDFKRTFAVLCKELKCPIVPVVIKGAFEALPTGHLRPRYGKKIIIKVLPPLDPNNTATDYDSLKNMTWKTMVHEWNRL